MRKEIHALGSNLVVSEIIELSYNMPSVIYKSAFYDYGYFNYSLAGDSKIESCSIFYPTEIESAVEDKL